MDAKLLSTPYLIDRLFDWASINSYSWNLEGLSKQLLEIQKETKCLQAQEEIKKLTPVKHFNLRAETEIRSLGEVLILRKRPQAKFQLLLSSHYDTVYPPEEGFNQAEFFENKSCIRGPGVADMKGGILIFLSALHALEHTPFSPEIGWTWIFSPDEEIGSLRSTPLLQELAKEADLGLVSESCLENGNIISSRKASLNALIVSKGKAAHAGRELHKGKNAIMQLTPLLSWLDSYQKKHDAQLNVGRIFGGGPLNTVPAQAHVGLNFRSSSMQELEHFQSALQAELIKLGKNTYTYHELSLRAPKPFTAKEEKLYEVYQDACKQAGIKLHWQESGGVCDGNTLAQAGLMNIDTLGAHGGQTHSHKEFIFVKSLEEKARALFFFFHKVSSMPQFARKS